MARAVPPVSHWPRFAALVLGLALMACAPPPAAENAPAVPTNPPVPSEAQKATVMRAVNAYFGALSRRDYPAAYAMFTDTVQGRTSAAEIAAFHRNNEERYGPIRKRTLQQVSWYSGGAKAGTGLAVAIDFHAEADRAAIICGYIAFFEMAPGKFELQRDDTTFVDPASEARLTGVGRRQVLDRPGCRRFLEN